NEKRNENPSVSANRQGPFHPKWNCLCTGLVPSARPRPFRYGGHRHAEFDPAGATPSDHPPWAQGHEDRFRIAWPSSEKKKEPAEAGSQTVSCYFNGRG